MPDVIDKLSESILRFVFNEFNNSYEKLLQEINQASLTVRRINDTLILVFLALNNAAPSYISDFLPSAKQASTVARQTQTSYSTCKSNKLWSLLISISCQETMELYNCRIMSVCLFDLLLPSKLH